MRIKKIVAMGTVCAMMIAMASGCGNASDHKADSLKIGGSFALTGDVAVYGKAASNGVKLAIEEYNAAGGVLGKQIEFILEDNKGSQVDASNAFKKLADKDQVVAFIGSDISSTTETIASIAKEKKIPMITPTGTNFKITSIGENIFRGCYVDPYQGEVLGQLASGDLKAKTAAIMVNSESDYSVGVAENFKKTFEAAGGKVVATVNYSSQDKDFKPILTNVKNFTPDVLVVPDYYTQIALIATQARELGITSTMIGPDGWDGALEQVPNNPEVLQNSYFINHYSPEDQSQITQDFIKNYKAKYNEAPNAFAALGYDSAKIMIEAIKSANATESEKITEAMKKTAIEGATGKITFDENRNPIKSVAVMEIKDGKYSLYKKLDPK